MTDKKNAAGGPIPAAGATRAATFIASPIIPDHSANPIQHDIKWQRDFAQALGERTLTVWALRLIDAKPAENRRAYVWQQLLLVELRRRYRTIDVATLDCCPRCAVVGLWWNDKVTGDLMCVACNRDGGAK